MKRSFYLFLILFSIYSCDNSSNDEIETEKKCFITKFNPVVVPLYGQELFTSEFIYNSQNDIIKKLDFDIIQGNVSEPLTTQIKSTTEIIYSTSNLPIKIVEQPNIYNIQLTEYLSYTNGKLVAKDRVTTNIADNLSSKWKYEYSYTDNKITSVIGKHYDSNNILDLNEITTVVYGANDNVLSVTKVSSSVSVPNYISKTITEYGDYDSYKNPFKDLQVPFEDYIFIRYSQNNYTKYSKRHFVNDIPQSYETKTFTYTYNEKNYPKTAEFRCNY